MDLLHVFWTECVAAKIIMITSPSTIWQQPQCILSFRRVSNYVLRFPLRRHTTWLVISQHHNQCRWSSHSTHWPTVMYLVVFRTKVFKSIKISAFLIIRFYIICLWYLIKASLGYTYVAKSSRSSNVTLNCPTSTQVSTWRKPNRIGHKQGAIYLLLSFILLVALGATEYN